MAPAMRNERGAKNGAEGGDAKRPRLEYDAEEAKHPPLVMKFGGSSLAGGVELRRVAEIVRQRLAHRPVLVLSAMGKTTNMLLKAAETADREGTTDTSEIRKVCLDALEELGVPVPPSVDELLTDLGRVLSGIAMLKEISGRTRDYVVSFGERLSVRVFAAYFNNAMGKDGPQARPLDSWEVGMQTTSGTGSAESAFSQVEVLPSAHEDIKAFFRPLRSDYSFVPVVTGYIAKDMRGVITTLGRDGSDLTATLIGAATQASEVQIWKDVPGILTTDPRIVPSARVLDLITYEEAAELSTFGAKVVHPAAITPAWVAKVPMSVRDSTAPDQPGTRIVAELKPTDRSGKVAAISSKRGITLIIIRSTRMLGQHGFLAAVFRIFNQYEASVDVIATSEVTVSLTLERTYKQVDIKGLVSSLEEVATVTLMDHMAMLTLISDKQDATTVFRKSFAVFGDLGVNVEMVSHGASNVNVTFILPEKDLTASTRGLHAVFFEP